MPHVARGTFTASEINPCLEMDFLKKGFMMLLFLSTIKGFSQTSDGDQSSAWQLNATYKGDIVSNFSGGIKTGSTYLGLADLFLHFDAEEAGLWKGGEFLVRGSNSHGGEPSANLVGDFQVVSNIEAGNHSFLYELWYKQTISNVSVTIGLQDLNDEFVSSDVASLFINSSFGVHSVISDNISAPIFPLTSPGITFCWKTSEKINLKTAIYKGCPINFDTNPYNIKWDLNHLEGLLWVTESQFSWTGIQEKNNVFKAGVFFHQHCPEGDDVNSEARYRLTSDYGFYLIGDHQVFSNEKRGLSIFYQLGVSPRNDNFGYLGAGCAYTGLFSKKGADVIGLAFAYGLIIPQQGRNETTFELTYKAHITNQIYLQPEMQYVMHPGGTDAELKNVMVGLVRLGLEF